MPDKEYDVVPPLRRPTLLLALFGSCVAIALGFTSGDERALLSPAVVALLWAAAYRAQPSESARAERAQRRPGAVVVRRIDPSPARPRKLMPPAPSRLSPAAAVAASDAKQRKGNPSGRPLTKRVEIGLPDLPEATGKRRKSRGKRKGGAGDPTLGL